MGLNTWHLLTAILVVVLAMISVMPIPAQAAGFNCGKASKPAEKAICADPELSTLDEKLRVAEPLALKSTINPESLKDAQRAWLASRDGCGVDIPCLRKSYRDRLDQLLGVEDPGVRLDFSWYTNWQLDPSTRAPSGIFVVIVFRPNNSHLIDFDAQVGHGPQDVNKLSGTAALRGDGSARYFGPGDCRLDFVPGEYGRLQVTQYGHCGQSAPGLASIELGGAYLDPEHRPHGIPDFSSGLWPLPSSSPWPSGSRGQMGSVMAVLAAAMPMLLQHT